MKVNLEKLRKALKDIAVNPVYLYNKRGNHRQYVKIQEVVKIIRKLRKEE